MKKKKNSEPGAVQAFVLQQMERLEITGAEMSRRTGINLPHIYAVLRRPTRHLGLLLGALHAVITVGRGKHRRSLQLGIRGGKAVKHNGKKKSDDYT